MRHVETIGFNPWLSLMFYELQKPHRNCNMRDYCMRIADFTTIITSFRKRTRVFK